MGQECCRSVPAETSSGFSPSTDSASVQGQRCTPRSTITGRTARIDSGRGRHTWQIFGAHFLDLNTRIAASNTCATVTRMEKWPADAAYYSNFLWSRPTHFWRLADKTRIDPARVPKPIIAYYKPISCVATGLVRNFVPEPLFLAASGPFIRPVHIWWVGVV